MNYEEQLKFKKKKVQNVMNKTLGQNSVEVLETLGMKDGYHIEINLLFQFKK